MLALWTLGTIFLFMALKTLVGHRNAFWIALVFVLTPVWAVWSMKARGGYITSFTATAAVFWLVVQDPKDQTLLHWLAVGALTSVVYLAQPLWLPGLLPILVVVLISRRSRLCALACFAIVAATVFFVRTSGAGSAAPPLGNADVPGSVPLMGWQLYELLTGAHDFAWTLDTPGPITRILAVVWCAILPTVVVLQAYRLLTKRYCRWSHLLFFSLATTLASELVMLHSRDARYLLPVGALLVMLIGIELVDLVDRGLLKASHVAGVTLAFLLLGAVSMGEFRNFMPLWKNPPASQSENARMRRLFAYLGVEGVSHVFSMNGLLVTQLTFYSDEKIEARWAAYDERYQPYVEDVDHALAAGERVAVVGYMNTSGAPGCWDVPICTGGIEAIVPNPEQIFTVDGKYFAYVGASRPLLERLHFRFPD